MMFKVMAFKFCPIHIKHQIFNFKLKKRCLHATALFSDSNAAFRAPFVINFGCA